MSRLAGVTAVLILAAAGCDSAPAQPDQPPPRRGFAVPTYEVKGYDAVEAADHLSEIKAVGGTWVQLNPTWYQKNPAANRFGRTSESVSDAGLRRMIRLARATGLRVSVKPHLDLASDADRATIRPADPDAWFATYRTFVAHYAVIAANEGAAEFVVGTELAGVSTDRARWLDVVADARSRFSGTLVYAANYDEYERVAFWDAVDVIGIDAYFPLSGADVGALLLAWAPIRARLAALSAAHGRPVLFTEAGYRSQAGTLARPYSYTLTTQADQREQAAGYEALLRAFEDQSWWMGVDWWMWTELPVETTPPALSYSPRGKLAEIVLATRWTPR